MTVSTLIWSVTDQRPSQFHAATLRGGSFKQGSSRWHRKPCECTIEHRDINELALSITIAGAKRGKDSEGSHQCTAANIGDLASRLNRCSISITGKTKQTSLG